MLILFSAVILLTLLAKQIIDSKKHRDVAISKINALRPTTIIPVIAAALILFTTQNFKAQMVVPDSWSAIIGMLALVQITLAGLMWKFRTNNESYAA